MRRSVPESRLSWSETSIECRPAVRKNSCRSLQNCVDTLFTLPQYLVLRMLPVQQVGRHFAFGPKYLTSFARENRSRRNLHGNEEESQKRRNTNRLRNDTSHGPRISTSLSGEAPLERRFVLRHCNLASPLAPSLAASKFSIRNRAGVSQYCSNPTPGMHNCATQVECKL